MARDWQRDDLSFAMPDDNFWLFGYGSLIWKPPPHFGERVPGYIKGYVRRFWQVKAALHPLEHRVLWAHIISSEDHRGTPEAPGRVVTLIQTSFWETLGDPQSTTANDKVWGAAYRIIPNKVKEVQEYLDIREINGYSIQYTPFHPADVKRNEIRCMVYIGMPDNPQFLGAQHPADVAKTIRISRGPSGENRDYLFQLEQSLNTLSTESADEHVSDLARRIRALPRLQSGEKIEEAAVVHLRKVSSTEEQDEIEKNE